MTGPAGTAGNPRLRDLSGVITAAHLSLPGGMHPLWGPDERRVMP
ncbi:hypothetical protein [Mycolicibacterium peregrinum]|nr:hypothetical protein [Mycolicibacterium peregrinum]